MHPESRTPVAASLAARPSHTGPSTPHYCECLFAPRASANQHSFLIENHAAPPDTHVERNTSQMPENNHPCHPRPGTHFGGPNTVNLPLPQRLRGLLSDSLAPLCLRTKHRESVALLSPRHWHSSSDGQSFYPAISIRRPYRCEDPPSRGAFPASTQSPRFSCEQMSATAVPNLPRAPFNIQSLPLPFGSETPLQTVVLAPASVKPPLTRNQVRSFWAAWGGWTMDGMDSFIYSLVLVPALTDLLPKSGIRANTANVGYYGGLLFALFMVGWGAALIWGPIADRFGRVRTMMFSITAFSVFTLLSAFATNVWMLGFFRFLAGVGIGGEWSIGAALVSEDWPEERRTMGAALMHTGYYFGFFLAAAANYFIGSRFGWRYMFVVGGVPALFVGFMRNNVEEPIRWEQKITQLDKESGKKWGMHNAFLELFSPEYRRRTILNSLYLIVSLVGLWAGSVYVPAAITYIAQRVGRSPADAARSPPIPPRFSAWPPCWEPSSFR